MARALDAQEFLDDYKDRLAPTGATAPENERTQVEERIRMVNLIRDALTPQDDVTRPIDPKMFVEYLRDVASGNQAVLPFQRGDAHMKALAMDLLQRWENRHSYVEQDR